MYIALEGLDGTGKTTLFNNLNKRLKKEGYDFSTICTTLIVDKTTWPERLYHSHYRIKKINFFRYIIFAYRSRLANKNTKWDKNLILGDRCIVGTYAKRWKKIFYSRWLTIKIVDFLEPCLPTPDYVIYLSAPMNTILDRLNSKEVREVDETPFELKKMMNAYNSPQQLENSTFELIKSLIQ